MTSEGCTCCNIDSLFGYSLARSIVFVSIATIVSIIISIVGLTAALASIISTANETNYNNKPMMAIDMVCSLCCCSISMYQIVISLILVARKTPYACSLWFTSHLSILTCYALMFSARAFVSYKTKQYHIMVIGLGAFAIYEGVFIFFLVVVYSYMQLPIEDPNVNMYY